MLRKSETSERRSMSSHVDAWRTLAHLLCDRAKRHPDRPALTFLPDDSFDRSGDEITLTYQQLHARASELAARLVACNEITPGDRAMLLFPPGLEFMVGFLGCQLARLTPVPTSYPKPGRAMPRLDASVRDCLPSVLVTDVETLDAIDFTRVSEATAGLVRIATDELAINPPTNEAIPSDTIKLDEIESADLALLQYTSGSTSDPKGVMVSHANLLCNLESIRRSFAIDFAADDSDDFQRGLFWLPPFHDMGLIGGILEPLYVGGHAILMSPRSFLARPLRWLRAISDHGAKISGAPNFAYQLCVDRIDSAQAETLDLSSWDLAFCGAEPINADTLIQFERRFAVSGFRGHTFCPCYGLAEATLMAASCPAEAAPRLLHVDREELTTGRAKVLGESVLGEISIPNSPAMQSTDASIRQLVSSGEPAHAMTLKIVDAKTRLEKPDGEIGEVWIAGPSVAAGYWRRDDINQTVFSATLADDETGDLTTGETKPTYLRTGDLAFVRDGEIYVTGRSKDVVILRGRNHFPQDIEATVKAVLPDEVLQCVAVATTGRTGDALAIAAEVSRHIEAERLPDLIRQIRRAIIDDHDVDARQVLIARPGGIPLTTSGKVQRQQCRTQIDRGEFKSRHEWSRNRFLDDADASILPPLPTRITRDGMPEAIEQITAWLLIWLAAHAGDHVTDGDDEYADINDQAGGLSQSPSNTITPDTPFAETGMDSLTAVELSSELEDWLGIELTPVLAFNYPTPARLAAHLAEELAGLKEEPSSDETSSAGLQSDIDASDLSPEELEALLSEIENES